MLDDIFLLLLVLLRSLLCVINYRAVGKREFRRCNVKNPGRNRENGRSILDIPFRSGAKTPQTVRPALEKCARDCLKYMITICNSNTERM